MPQNLRGRRPRRFGHNLLIRGGLRAYALTLPLLGFECTWYEIKSRDMNEKGKEFIFYNKPYMPSAGFHGPLHMVCALSPVPAPTLALDLHAHTQHSPSRSLHYVQTQGGEVQGLCLEIAHTVVLPAAWAEGWRGACTQMYSSYSL